MRPSTIFSITAGGLPVCSACLRKIARSESSSSLAHAAAIDRDRRRIGRRDVHRHVLRERLRGLARRARRERHQHAELAARVHVAADHAALRRRDVRGALHDDVLAELGDRRRDAIGDLLAVDRRLLERRRREPACASRATARARSRGELA